MSYSYLLEPAFDNGFYFSSFMMNHNYTSTEQGNFPTPCDALRHFWKFGLESLRVTCVTQTTPYLSYAESKSAPANFVGSAQCFTLCKNLPAPYPVFFTPCRWGGSGCFTLRKVQHISHRFPHAELPNRPVPKRGAVEDESASHRLIGQTESPEKRLRSVSLPGENRLHDFSRNENRHRPPTSLAWLPFIAISLKNRDQGGYRSVRNITFNEFLIHRRHSDA